MTTHLSRSRADLIVGFWAIAPALLIPLLFYAWWHHVSAFPSDVASSGGFDGAFQSTADHLLAGMFAAGAVYLIALVVVIRDIWMRPLEQNVRIMWTILTLLISPFGGVVYWFVACHSRRGVG